jgi:hypothetical protein
LVPALEVGSGWFADWPLRGSAHKQRTLTSGPIYPPRIKVTDSEMAMINITPHAFYGEWNYTIAPKLE